jgi:hypothetical protein
MFVIAGTTRRRVDCRKIKAVRKVGRETKGAGLQVSGRCGRLTTTLSERAIVFRFVIGDRHVVCVAHIPGHRAHAWSSSLIAFFRFNRGPEVGLLHRSIRRGGRLIDAESKLHAFDCTGFGVLASLAVPFFFDSSLLNHLARRVVFEIWGLQFLNSLMGFGFREERWEKERIAQTALSPCQVWRVS